MARADGRIDWEAPAAGIDRRVRACLPWPVAEAGLRGERVQILEAEPIDAGAGTDAPGAPPGLVLDTDDRLVIACGGGSRLAVRSLKWPGRRALSAREAVNGRLVARGERFTAPPG